MKDKKIIHPITDEEMDSFNPFEKNTHITNDKEHFPEMSIRQLQDTLRLTIKEDDTNKSILFLGCLSAFTDKDQLNILFNAPSSTGKSYIASEVIKFFPEEDVITKGYSSATAPFHDTSVMDEEGRYIIDWEKKILFFMDQPDAGIMPRLRPIMSHDTKAYVMEVADKGKKGGLKTKTTIIKGYPAIIFCTAGVGTDEQEISRCFLLSPEVTSSKINKSLNAIAQTSALPHERIDVESNIERIKLKERIVAIRDTHVGEIYIPQEFQIEERYKKLVGKNNLKPTDQRGLPRLMSLVKMHALLNVWHREKYGDGIIVNEADIEAGLELFSEISASQTYGISGFTYGIYTDVLQPLWEEQTAGEEAGVLYKDIHRKYHEVNGLTTTDKNLKKEIFQLETAGLVQSVKDSTDGRKLRILPGDYQEDEVDIFAELESNEGEYNSPEGVSTELFGKTA